MGQEEMDRGRFVGQFDWQEVTPQMAVVEAVETAAGREHHEFDALYEYVDPDAMEILFEDSSDLDEVELTFTFDPFRVTVRDDGSVFVQPADRDRSDPPG